MVNLQSYRDTTSASLVDHMPVIIEVSISNYSHMDPESRDVFLSLMANTMKYVVDNIPSATFAYAHSGSVTIVLPYSNPYENTFWCDNSLRDITSEVVSMVSAKYNILMREVFEDPAIVKFNCHVYNVPHHKVGRVFQYQQKTLTSQELQRTFRTYYPDAEHLFGDDNEMVEFLMRMDIPVNWNDLPIHVKRGIAYNKMSGKVDPLIPVFEQSPEYVQMHIEYFEPPESKDYC